MAIQVQIDSKKLIEKLIHKSREWDQFFVMSCEGGPDYLTTQAEQWRDELADRGYQVERTDVEDALLELASELCPDSPAAVDPKTYLFHKAGRWLTEQGKPFSVPPEAEEAFNGAWLELESLGEFRRALREWVRAGLENGKETVA
jgi:hypothetical protein